MNKHSMFTGSIFVPIACAVLLAGCSKEDNPVGPATRSVKQPVVTTYSFSEQLDRNSAEDRDARQIVVAYASDEPPTVPQAPFPVLYLLHDYLGDAGYFERYSLQTMVDEMYKNGEIGRMLIVTVDASNYFGGSYYRNSGTTGSYEDLLTATISSIEATYRVHTRAGRSARAIGGHGMGGYGAMRYALEHPEMFSSVSSLSGPLSLGDPANQSGIWDADDGLISMVFEQNGTGPGDASLYAKLQSGRSLYYETGNLMAMASAFSARPLRIFDSVGVDSVPKFPFRGEWIQVMRDFYSAKPASPNTISFASLVDTFRVGVDLPFDSSGAPTDSIWAKWRDVADVKNTFLIKRQQNPSLWNDMSIYFDVGLENQYGYLEQNRDFDRTLTQAGVAHIYEEYERSGALPAGHSDLLLARMRKAIKFHSDQLERPAGPSRQ